MLLLAPAAPYKYYQHLWETVVGDGQGGTGVPLKQKVTDHFTILHDLSVPVKWEGESKQ